MPPAAKATTISGNARMVVGGGDTSGGIGFAATGASALASGPRRVLRSGNCAPQPVQTVALMLSTLPQTAHGLRSSGTPQAAQKRSPGGLSCWQLGQCESSIETG